MSAAAHSPDLAHAFEAENRRIWALCYRMTGSAADADDLVQATFERALERPPRDTARPWRPWLMRVAVNLARDALRRRRRRAYKGPWLPEPVDTDDLVEHLGDGAGEPRIEPESTEGRYDLLESVSFAFLVALEALTPTQRAVLLLRDVLEYSGRESAEALEMSEPNVRKTLGRARRAMLDYDAERFPGPANLEAETRALAAKFLGCLATRDVKGMETLLTEDALTLSDGAGKYAAAGVPVVGRQKVARFQVGITKGMGDIPGIAWCRLNGTLALVLELDEATRKERQAPRIVILPRLSSDGRIAAFYMVLAPDKFTRTPSLSEARARYAQA